MEDVPEKHKIRTLELAVWRGKTSSRGWLIKVAFS
jgi:hypothetical protein